LRCRCREGGVPDIDRAFWQKRWEAREREILEETAYRAVPAILAPLDTNSDTNPTNTHQHGPTSPSVTTGLWESSAAELA
jgi:hypothetical protein